STKEWPQEKARTVASAPTVAATGEADAPGEGGADAAPVAPPARVDTGAGDVNARRLPFINDASGGTSIRSIRLSTVSAMCRGTSDHSRAACSRCASAPYKSTTQAA